MQIQGINPRPDWIQHPQDLLCVLRAVRGNLKACWSCALRGFWGALRFTKAFKSGSVLTVMRLVALVIAKLQGSADIIQFLKLNNC